MNSYTQRYIGGWPTGATALLLWLLYLYSPTAFPFHPEETPSELVSISPSFHASGLAPHTEMQLQHPDVTQAHYNRVTAHYVDTASHHSNAQLALMEAFAHQPVQATSRAKAVISKTPRDTLAHLALAKVAYDEALSPNGDWPAHRNKHLNTALDHLNLILAEDSHMPQVWQWRGLTHQALKNPKQAQQDFEKAHQLHPNETGYLVNLGYLAIEESQPIEAIRLSHLILEKDPQHVDALAIQGLGFIQLKQYSSAEAPLKKASSLNPQHAYAHSGLGQLYSTRNQQALATHHLNESIRLAPRYVPFREALAVHQAKQQQLNEAISQHKAMISLGEDAATHFGSIGQLQLKNNDALEAIASFHYAESLQGTQGATALDRINGNLPPSTEAISIGLAKANVQAAQHPLTPTEHKATHLQEALRYAPKDLAIYHQLEQQQLQDGASLQDAAMLKRMVSTPPLNDVQRLQHIQALYQLAEFEQANGVYRVLIQNQHGNITHLTSIAHTLETVKAYPLAKETYRLVVKHAPDNRLAKEGLERIRLKQNEATTLYYQGTHSTATPLAREQLLQAALQQDPTLAKAHIALALHYKSLQRTQEAKQHYTHYFQLAKSTMTLQEAAEFQQMIHTVR
jgi:Tfp pilus assembly protein PilF